MVHLPGISAGELHPASVSLWLIWLPVATSLHRGLHGCFKSDDGCVYMHAGPRGCSYTGRIWSPWSPLGRGSWLSSDRMGLGVFIWGQCVAVDSCGSAVWCERDVHTRLWKIPIPRERTHLCSVLPRSLPHACFSPIGRSRGVWVLAFLPSLASATIIFSTAVLPGLSLGPHYDEHPVLAYSHRFAHPPLLGVTQRGVWGLVGLCYDQTCCLANIHQWPSLCTCSFPLPLFPSWSPFSGGGSAKISSSASPAPPCLPEPSPLPSFHAGPLSVVFLASTQSTHTVTSGPHLGLVGFCGHRKELLLRFIDTGVTHWRHVRWRIFSQTPTGSNPIFPLLLHVLCSSHPLPNTTSHCQR